MKILSLLFALISRFVKVDPKEFTQLQEEATTWYDAIRWDEDVKKGIKWYFKYYAEQWYTRLGFALIYIPLVKYIQDFMLPKEEEEKKF